MKPDYSRFCLAMGRKKMSNTVPLRHGHLENYAFWRERTMLRAATKLQNLFRKKVACRVAEKAAKSRAFVCARTRALDDTRRKITDQMWKVQNFRLVLLRRMQEYDT